MIFCYLMLHVYLLAGVYKSCNRDLSYNNLSGSLPKISARTFKWANLSPVIVNAFKCMLLWCLSYKLRFLYTFRVIGNPLICGPKAGNNCSAVFPEPLSLPPDGLKGVYYCAIHAFFNKSFWHFFSALQFDYMFEYLDLWFLSSIGLWIKRSSCSCCFWCKLWCCFFHHTIYRITCLVAL